MSTDAQTSSMPDEFDRLYGGLDGLPDVVKTKASTLTVTPPFGVGGSRTFIVQTVRQRDIGDTVFLQVVGASGSQRIALPPNVTDVIARQRDSITGQVRSKVARATAAERKAAGKKPGFKMSPAERAAAKRERDQKKARKA